MDSGRGPSIALVGLLLGLLLGSSPVAAGDSALSCVVPDVNKDLGDLKLQYTCWLATAANMLAAADYGDHDLQDAQERADAIYSEMVAHYWRMAVEKNKTCIPSGWVDAALEWWLTANQASIHPPAAIKAYGNKVVANPWTRENAWDLLANEIKESGATAAISIARPSYSPNSGYAAHSVTVWQCGSLGQELRVSDSDRLAPDWKHDTENYPLYSTGDGDNSGSTLGPGWYFDYDVDGERLFQNERYVWCAFTLDPGGCQGDVSTMERFDTAPGGSGALHSMARAFAQASPWASPAFRFTALQPGDGGQPGCLADEPGPIPLAWDVTTPEIGDYDEASLIPNVTGGYVIGAFDVCDPSGELGQRLVASYRLIKRYAYYQSPEKHVFTLAGTMATEVAPAGTALASTNRVETPYVACNFRFGHSYGYLNRQELWAFDDWMTERSASCRIRDEPFRITINWPGRLPYPEALPFGGRVQPDQADLEVFGDERKGIGLFDNTASATAGGLCVVFDREVSITNVLGFGGNLTLQGDRQGYVFVLSGSVPPRGTIELDWEPGTATVLGSMWLRTGLDVSGNRMEMLLREVLGDTPLPPYW